MENTDRGHDLHAERRLLLSSVVAVIASATPFMAQSAFAAEPHAAKRGVAANQEASADIVVTARKREERLQDVPISVAAISGEDIEAKSLDNVQNLAQFTPNVQFSQPGTPSGKGAGSLFIRGVGQPNTDPLFQPGVGVYLDGVYLQTMQGLNFGLLDTERVEVLYGPQGTLFGRNTIGGAISIVSKRPTDDFSGHIELETGNYNRTDAKALVNGAIVPGVLAARISASIEKADGYGKILDFNTGAKIGETGDTDRLAGRASFLWTMNDSMEALLTIDGQRVREANTPFHIVDINQSSQLLPVFNFILSLAGIPPLTSAVETDNPFVSYGNGPNYYNLNAWNAALTYNWDLGSVQFKSISAYRHVNMKTGVDFDGSPYDYVGSATIYDQYQVTQEFQLNGQSFDNRLNWTTGLFYLYAKNDGVSANDFLLSATRIGAPNFTSVFDATNVTESLAGYGQATFSLTDKLRMTLGGRYSYDRAAYTFDQRQYPTASVLGVSSGIAALGDGTLPSVVVQAPATGRAHWGAFSGMASVDYHFTPDVMTYASIGRGFKGGIPPQPNVAQPVVAPEYIVTYEVGFKSQFLDHHLTFNAALYHSNYTDQQLAVLAIDGNGNPTTLFTNAGKSRIQGAELELVARPTNSLSLSANLGLIDAKFTALDPGSPVTLDTKFQQTPKAQYSVSGEYVLPLADIGAVTTRLDYAHQSSTQHEISNLPVGFQPAYGLLNGRITFETRNRAWALSLSATNLTNKRYQIGSIVNVENTVGLNIQQYGRPREWKLSLRYSF